MWHRILAQSKDDTGSFHRNPSVHLVHNGEKHQQAPQQHDQWIKHPVGRWDDLRCPVLIFHLYSFLLRCGRGFFECFEVQCHHVPTCAALTPHSACSKFFLTVPIFSSSSSSSSPSSSSSSGLESNTATMFPHLKSSNMGIQYTFIALTATI